ncbi:hypothetical protein R6Q57_024195 [Mikania cordata]
MYSKLDYKCKLVGQRGPLTGMGQTFVQVVKKEGPRALYLGLTPALTRFHLEFVSGAFATLLTNPMEVVKRLVSCRKLLAKEGITALWKGVGPAMARAGALTASQMATYDEFKQVLLKRTSLEEGLYLHLVSSTIAGSMSTLITAPMDMVKTRLMLQRESMRDRAYKNGFHCAYKVLITEGPQGLYKGGFAIFARLGPQTTITFVLCEKLRELAGLKAI